MILYFLRRFFVVILIATIFLSPQPKLWAQQELDNVHLNPAPVDPEELDLLGQIKIFIDQLNNKIDELLFYSFVSALPLMGSVSSYGPNEIGLIAPNPYFRLSLISGMQFVLPIVNFDLIKSGAGEINEIKKAFNSTLNQEETTQGEETENTDTKTNINMGPANFIASQNNKYGISLPTAMVFFSLRFQLTLGIKVLDKMQFGLTYSTPKVSVQPITNMISQSIFPYTTDITIYGVNIRYKVLEDPIATVAVGGSFNHVKFSFATEMLAEDPSKGWETFEHARVRRAQKVYPENKFNIDQQFPTLGPYEILINYQTKVDYYMSSLDFFMRADFGIPLFRPFVDFGMTLKLSEVLKHSSGYFLFIREPTSLNPLDSEDPGGRYVDLDRSQKDTNVLLRDYHPYNYRKSGVSVVTPRISLGFNALYVINFHTSISFLRAESPVPAVSLALFINLDF